MSIEAIRELETLASVCPELNMANYTEDDVRHLNDWAIEMSLLVERYTLSQQTDNAACKSVQKRLAAQQSATAIACGIPGMVKTTCPYCEQGFAFEHEQPATGEPVKSFAELREKHRAGIEAERAKLDATTEPVAQWQKRHPVRTAGRWQNTDEHDAKWWHENAKGWEVRALYTRPAPSAAATGEPVDRSEREQLRHAQAAVVMPMIGPLLDAWENSDREVMSQEPELSKQLKNINSAMEDADTHPAPSVPVTGEPVWCVATGERVNGEETYTHHDAYVPLADCFPLYTHPAPGVPDDVQRDAERYRWLRSLEHCNEAWCFIGSGNANSNLDAAIDAAMLTATQAKKETP